MLSTACPPAVVADMICRGELATHTGVLPSERCVPYGPLFSRLERYGVSVREEVRLEPYGSSPARRSSSSPSCHSPAGSAPVAPHDPDPAEADPLVAADRALVGRGGVDRQAVVAALVDQVPRERPHRVRAEALPVALGVARKMSMPAWRKSGVVSSWNWIIPTRRRSTSMVSADRVVLLAAGLLGELGDA